MNASSDLDISCSRKVTVRICPFMAKLEASFFVRGLSLQNYRAQRPTKAESSPLVYQIIDKHRMNSCHELAGMLSRVFELIIHDLIEWQSSF